jgi:hypothetical protein
MNWTLTNSQRQEMVDDFLTVVPARPANMDRMIRGSCHSSRRRAALATGGGERAGRNGSCDNCGNVFPTAVSSTLLLALLLMPSSGIGLNPQRNPEAKRGNSKQLASCSEHCKSQKVFQKEKAVEAKGRGHQVSHV